MELRSEHFSGWLRSFPSTIVPWWSWTPFTPHIAILGLNAPVSHGRQGQMQLWNLWIQAPAMRQIKPRALQPTWGSVHFSQHSITNNQEKPQKIWEPWQQWRGNEMQSYARWELSALIRMCVYSIYLSLKPINKASALAITDVCCHFTRPLFWWNTSCCKIIFLSSVACPYSYGNISKVFRTVTGEEERGGI